MFKGMFAFLLLSLGLNVSGQCLPGKSLVTVTGTGEIKVIPDEATFFISVENFAKESAAARSENSSRLEAVVSVLKGLGIGGKDYQATGLVVSPRYKNDSDAKPLIGYSASVHLTVKLRDLKKAQELNARALAAGATSFRLSSYGTSELSKHRAEARALAMKAAREKAGFLAAQLGQKIGAAFSIVEGNSASPSVYAYARLATANIVGDASGEGETTGGVIEITESVTVSFELQ